MPPKARAPEARMVFGWGQVCGVEICTCSGPSRCLPTGTWHCWSRHCGCRRDWRRHRCGSVSRTGISGHSMRWSHRRHGWNTGSSWRVLLSTQRLSKFRKTSFDSLRQSCISFLDGSIALLDPSNHSLLPHMDIAQLIQTLGEHCLQGNVLISSRTSNLPLHILCPLAAPGMRMDTSYSLQLQTAPTILTTSKSRHHRSSRMGSDVKGSCECFHG